MNGSAKTIPIDARDVQSCIVCGDGVAHAGSPFFYRVTIETAFLDTRNIQRMHGLEQMMGGLVGIARALSPDNTVAQAVPASSAWVCSACALDPQTSLPLLIDAISERDEKEEADDR